MYRIEYLNTPASDENRMGMWGFNLRLSTEFMEKVEALDMTKADLIGYQTRFRKRISDEIICRIWNPDLYEH